MIELYDSHSVLLDSMLNDLVRKEIRVVKITAAMTHTVYITLMDKLARLLNTLAHFIT